MLRRLALLALLSAFLALPGCGPAQLQVQAVSATAVARVANTTLPLLQDGEKKEGLDVIATAPSDAQAKAGLEVVRARWASVWVAWEAMRALQDAWADAILATDAGKLDIGGAVVLASKARVAYCALRAVVPPPTAIPDFPGLPCKP